MSIAKMEKENLFKISKLDNYAIGEFSDTHLDFEDFVDELDENNQVLSMTSFSANVHFLNINEETVVYKYQSRVRKEAKQRLKDAVIEILVTSGHEIMKLNAWIQREEKAAELFNYDVGRVPFAQRDIVHKNTKYLDNESIQHLYSIDLDAIYYDHSDTKRPVYKLAKTDMFNRNRFQVVIQLMFIDGSVTQDFVSPAFYCCTQPKQNLKRKFRLSRDLNQSSQGWLENEIYRDNQVVELLQAEKAVIANLEVKNCFKGPKKKADIAYHFDLEDSEIEWDFDEGDVVGLKEKSNSQASITKLTSTNIHQIHQTGVISRSAFFEGNCPSEGNCLTEKICVLGMVPVKVMGNIVTGERVYASVSYPGKAIAESHLSRRSQDDILLGIAIETSDEGDPEMERLVQCFVSFLFAITNTYFCDKTRELQSHTKLEIDKAINKRWKRMRQSFIGFLIILGLLALWICFVFSEKHSCRLCDE